jgi:signal transduction histidine kinase
MFLTTMVAVCVGVVFESKRHTDALRKWAHQEVVSVADALKQDFLNLMLLGDPDGAANLVRRLSSFPLIETVDLYANEGAAVFQYRRDPSEARKGDDDGADRFKVNHELGVNEVVYGRIELTASGAQLSRDISEYYQNLAGLFVTLLLVSIASAWYFQRFFTGPLLKLKAFMSGVATQRDFSLRARTDRRDEYGVVFNGLNELLGEVQTAQRRVVEEYMAKEDALRAKYSAESANREKSTFLASMSHELRTPLNAIIGYSELQEEDALAAGNTTAADDLRKIRTAGKHLLSLINDVLDLSKIEAGRMTLEIGPVRVSTLIEEVLELIQPLLARGGNRVCIDVDVGDLVINSDGLRLRQILFNLLSNACKFTERGVITVGARVENDRVRFSVRDTGVGLTADELKNLFQPFVQAGSVGKKHEGTGLGLVLSRRFCELLGGGMDATSVKGQGSEFLFRVPLESLPPKQ